MKVGKPLSNLYITQEFGDTTFAKTHRSWYRVYGGIHGGVDYRAGAKDFVYAIWDGEVTCKVNKGFGKHIYLLSENGRYMAIYAHLSLFKVGTGRKVSKGQIIGKAGSSGTVTGPHLHMEFRDLLKGDTIKEQIFDPHFHIIKGKLENDIMISKGELIKILGRFVGVDYKESDKDFQAHLNNPNLDRMLDGFFSAYYNKILKEILDVLNKLGR